MAANTNASSSIVNNNSSNSNIGKLEKNTERDNKLSSALGFPSNNSSSNLNNNNNSNPNSNRSSNINARGQRLNTSRKNVRPASSNSVAPASINSVSPASSNSVAPASSNLGSKKSRLPQDNPELSPYSINQQINNSTNQSRFSNNNNNNSSSSLSSSSLSSSSLSSSSLSPSSSSSRFGRSSRIAPSPSTSGSTFSSILPTNSSSPPNLSTSRFTTTSPSSSSSNVTQRNLPKKPEGYIEKNITNPGELATLKPQQKVTVKSAADNSFKEVTIIEGSFGDKVYKDPNNNNKYLKFLTFDPATTILVKSQRGGKGMRTRNKRRKNIKKTKSKHI